jgi:hypothetical protein
LSLSIPSVGTPALVVALLSLTAMAALADPITVNNPSFEILPPGGLPNSCGGTCFYNVGAVQDWTITAVQSGQVMPGVGGVPSFNTIPDGSTIAYLNVGGTISQTVGATVEAGVVYTMQVSLGLSGSGGLGFFATADLLVNGNQYLATGALPTPGNWSVYTATYTGLAADVGDPITIELNSTDLQGEFDNVQLTDNQVSVPAPVIGHGLSGVLAVSSVLFGATLFQRRKKHRSLGRAIRHAAV